jgi:hypothetical protein
MGNPVGRPVTQSGDVADTGSNVDQADTTTNGNNGNNGNTGNTNVRNNEFERGQGASDANLREERRHVEAAIDALSRDSWDYGGYKERAMDRLQAARAELDAALDFVHNKGVRNGGSGQHVSDANLQYVSEHIQTAIARLEQDRKDYGGHRVAAINDLQNARGFINSAMAYDKAHGDRSSPMPNAPITAPNGLPAGLPTMVPAPQGASHQSLVDARRHIETSIDALNRDAHDYGGYRVKAIDALQAARSQLLQALNFRG